MGYGMAMNIRKKMPSTSILCINDIHRPSSEKFVAEFSSLGPIEILNTAKEVAEHATTIVSIVPAAEHVRAVYMDSETGISAAKPNPARLMLECSTIDAATSREVGIALLKGGSGIYVDTPVSVSFHRAFLTYNFS